MQSRHTPSQGRAPEEGSQPAAELVWWLQSAPPLVLERVLRLIALSPNHTPSTRAGGVPTNPAVQTGPQHPHCTDTSEGLKAQTRGVLSSGQEGLERRLAWLPGLLPHLHPQAPSAIGTPDIRGGLSLMTERCYRTKLRQLSGAQRGRKSCLEVKEQWGELRGG